MTQQEKVALVQKMQDEILRQSQRGSWEPVVLYAALGYSRRHADRLFKEFFDLTPQEYYRRVRLSHSAGALFDENKSILEVALDADFSTHEGYTKAFSAAFGIPPSRYKTGRHPISLFVPYPISTYYNFMARKDDDSMAEPMLLCTITAVERPARRLVFMRSQKATDYFSFCEEVGCDWEGLFNSIPAKFDTAALLTLPPSLVIPGGSPIAAGVELPADYDGEIPDGCEAAELPPCILLYFRSQPFTSDEEFFPLMGAVLRAAEVYDPTLYGYAHAPDSAPRFNFGGQAGKGASVALPVQRIEK